MLRLVSVDEGREQFGVKLAGPRILLLPGHGQASHHGGEDPVLHVRPERQGEPPDPRAERRSRHGSSRARGHKPCSAVIRPDLAASASVS